MPTVTIKMTDAQFATLAQEARERGTSKAGVLRDAFFRKQRGQASGESAYDLVADLVGSVEGPADLVGSVEGPADLVGSVEGPADLVGSVEGPADLATNPKYSKATGGRGRPGGNEQVIACRVSNRRKRIMWTPPLRTFTSSPGGNDLC